MTCSEQCLEVPQCRVVRSHDHVHKRGSLNTHAKKKTALAPSTMKTKDELPDGNIMFRLLRGVFPSLATADSHTLFFLNPTVFAKKIARGPCDAGSTWSQFGLHACRCRESVRIVASSSIFVGSTQKRYRSVAAALQNGFRRTFSHITSAASCWRSAER